MSSKKRASWSKQKEEFRTQLGDFDSLFANDEHDLFLQERQRIDETSRKKEEALREKACTSKNRYATRGEARTAIAECEAHGARGLREYRCPYCGGWHLTHKTQLD